MQRKQVLGVSGNGPAPEPHVNMSVRSRSPALDLQGVHVDGGGREFSGISMIVVTPPAAAARVAVANPSHSVRPGSLTWTWVSTRPGSSTWSSVRLIVRSPTRPAPGSAITLIRPCWHTDLRRRESSPAAVPGQRAITKSYISKLPIRFPEVSVVVVILSACRFRQVPTRSDDRSAVGALLRGFGQRLELVDCVQGSAHVEDVR